MAETHNQDTLVTETNNTQQQPSDLSQPRVEVTPPEKQLPDTGSDHHSCHILHTASSLQTNDSLNPNSDIPKPTETNFDSLSPSDSCGDGSKPNDSFADSLQHHVPKLLPPRQRASMLPKPEVGPKPSFLRQSPSRRHPLSSGPASLCIMSTSLPSPYASPTDSAESSR